MTKPNTPTGTVRRALLVMVLISTIVASLYFREKSTAEDSETADPGAVTIKDLPAGTFNHSPQGDVELVRLASKYGLEEKNSWHYEEWYILDFFEGKKDGTFLDVGAYHWKSHSNSVALEQKYGWTGIAIDAQQSLAAEYEQNRPKTTFFAYFVSDKSSESQKFIVPENTAMTSATEGWSAKLDQSKNEVQEIDTITLNDLLEREGVESIDFLNLDIEGWEIKALQGFDIEKYSPSLACVEAFAVNRKFVDGYFKDHGYQLIHPWSASDSHNCWYSKGGRHHWSENDQLDRN